MRHRGGNDRSRHAAGRPASAGAGPRRRRHLRGAGTRWQQLHDSVRRDVAMTMLRRPAARVAEVGVAIGFQDAREFRRAFKCWTGRSPSELRAGA